MTKTLKTNMTKPYFGNYMTKTPICRVTAVDSILQESNNKPVKVNY